MTDPHYPQPHQNHVVKSVLEDKMNHLASEGRQTVMSRLPSRSKSVPIIGTSPR